VGVLGGLVALRDKAPPPGAAGAGAGSARKHHGSLRLRAKRLRGGRVHVRLVGKGVRQVRRVTFYVRGKKLRRDSRRPFKATVARKRLRRHGRTRIVARIVRKDGTKVKRARKVRARRR
jgi:hypothetical protein